MKIVLLASIEGTGGIQRLMQGFIEALHDAGAEVAVVRREDAGSSLAFAFRAFFTILRVRPAMVICGHLYFSPIAYVGSWFGIPYMVFAHGIEVWDIAKRIHLRALRGAARVLAISVYTREKVMAQTGLPVDRFVLMPPFVRAEEFAPHPASPTFRAATGVGERKVILTVARLSASEQYKGYDAVIRAIPAVLAKVPDMAYVLVGGGDDLPRLRALVAAMHLENAVLMPGKVSGEDLLAYYNLCDVFAMPSKGEGFGIVFTEASACGKPVIAGNADGARDALLDGELGLLVDPDSMEALSKALIDCLSGAIAPELRNPSHLRTRVLAAYGFDRFKARVRDLLTISL